MEKNITVLGYSERGVLYSLFHEIAYKEKLDVIQKILGAVKYSEKNLHEGITSAMVMLDQSFSKYYGTPDVVLLLEMGQKKQVIFVEAKVKEEQKKQWKLEQEIKKYEELKGNSDIFSQLELKKLFCDELVKCKTAKDVEKIKGHDKKTIGKNSVVWDAAKKIWEHLKGNEEEIYFVALLPVDIDETEKDYRQKISDIEELKSKKDHFGLLAWKTVHEICAVDLPATLKIFEFNKGQIYKEDEESK